MKRTFFVLAILLLAAAAPAQTPPPPLISPEVHSDNRVAFRLRGPNIKEVAVSLEGNPKPLPMQRDDQGVWSVTSDPLAPDFYGYSIVADGVSMFDPSNHAIKPNFLYRASELHVPGPASLSWEIGAVPHGEIHHHFYKSGVVGTIGTSSFTRRPATTRAGSKPTRYSICCTDSATTRAP